jgi:hypothetical protein
MKMKTRVGRGSLILELNDKTRLAVTEHPVEAGQGQLEQVEGVPQRDERKCGEIRNNIVDANHEETENSPFPICADSHPRFQFRDFEDHEACQNTKGTCPHAMTIFPIVGTLYT